MRGILGYHYIIIIIASLAGDDNNDIMIRSKIKIPYTIKNTQFQKYITKTIFNR
jgi:hypothetical protein